MSVPLGPLQPPPSAESFQVTPSAENLQPVDSASSAENLQPVDSASAKYPEIEVIKLEISQEAEKKLLAQDQKQIDKEVSQNIKYLNELSEQEPDEADIGSSPKLSPKLSTTSVQAAINTARSLINYDICDTKNYKKYLTELTTNFTPTQERGMAYLYRSADQAQIDMYAFLKKSLESLLKKSLESLLKKSLDSLPDTEISPDTEHSTDTENSYYVLKEQFYKVDTDKNKKNTFLLILQVDQMNRLEPSKYFSNLTGTKMAIVLIEKVISVLSNVKNKKTGNLKYPKEIRIANHSLLRLRIMYGLNGKGRCERVTKLLEGKTTDLFKNDYKVGTENEDFTNEEKMLQACRDKFYPVDPRRSRCIRLVKSRLNFNDVLKKDCTLKNKNNISQQRRGGHKKSQKNGLSSRKKRHKRTQKKHKEIVYGGDGEIELIVLIVLLFIIGAILMGTAAVGNPTFIVGSVLLGLGVLLIGIISLGGDDDD